MSSLTGKPPRLVVFASGGAEPGRGGSGLLELMRATRAKPRPLLQAEIVGVVSNHSGGGVYGIARDYGVPFVHMPAPYDASSYQRIMKQCNADWAICSGWIKMVRGLLPQHTINIHPAPLPRFGGPGFYGLKPHQEVLTAFERGDIEYTAITMHFVTEAFDVGPSFFFFPIKLTAGESPEELQRRVNTYERAWQAVITDMVVNGEIRWDGIRDHPVHVPSGYKCRGFCPDTCVSITTD